MPRVRFTRPLASYELPANPTHLELRHANTHQTVLEPGEVCRINTGVAVEIPTGCVGIIQSHPDLARLANRKNAIECIGQILPAEGMHGDDRDEIHVVIRNVGLQKAYVLPSERVAILVVLPAFTAFDVVR